LKIFEDLKRKLTRADERELIEKKNKIITLQNERLIQIVKDIAPQRIFNLGGTPILIQGELHSDDNLDQTDADVAKAVRIIADKISGLPIVVERKIIQDGKETWEKDTDHQLNDLFRYINPHHDKTDFLTHICQGMIITGKSYFRLINTPVGVSEMWPIQPGMIRIEYDSSNIPIGYTLDPFKKKIPLKLEEVLYIHQYHFTAPFEGVSALQPIREEALSIKYAVTQNKKFFENGAMPDILFQDEGLSGIADSLEKTEQFIKSFDQRNAGVENHHKRAILPPGIKANVVTPTIKDMMFADLVKLYREQILGFLGVPPTEAGIMQYASYANALLEKKSFWEARLIPMKRRIEGSINRQVVYRYFGNDVRIRLDESGVPALQEDRKEQAEISCNLYNSGIITLNQAREIVGQEPVDDGDEFKAAPVNPFLAENNDEDDGDDDKSIHRFALPTGHIKLSSPKDKLRKTYEKKLTTYEKKYCNKVATYFGAQKKRILNNISDVTGRGYLMSMLYSEYKKMESKDESLPPEEGASIFNLAGENAILQKSLDPFYKEMIQEAGDDAISMAGMDFNFNIDDPWVQDEISRLRKRSEKINDKSFRTIKDLLREAYEDNWSLGQLENAIKEKYTGWIKGSPDKQSRAMTIARTETNAAVSGATNEGYKQAGARKEWLASPGARDSHAELDGRPPIDANAAWITINGDELRYPGDPNGSAKEVVNCRCAIMPAID